MKPKNILSRNLNLLLFSFILFSLTGTLASRAAQRDYYQVLVYKLNGKAQEAKVDNFLKNAYLPALHRAGVTKVGVFKPIETDTTAGKRVLVWVPYQSLDQFAQIQEKLLTDQDYLTKGHDFLEAPFDQPPFVRKESVLLKAFPDAPNFVIPEFSTPRSQRIYELRSYEAPTEYLFMQKAKMFNEGGEIKLFKKLGFNVVFNAEVVSGSTMPNLMYMSTFADMQSHDEHWKTFGNHPEWKAMSGLDEYQNTVSKAIIVLLHPTDYSDF